MIPHDLTKMRDKIRALRREADNLAGCAEVAENPFARERDHKAAGVARTMAAGVEQEYLAWFAGQPTPRCPVCCILVEEPYGSIYEAIPEMYRCGTCGEEFLAMPKVSVLWDTTGAGDAI